MAGIQRSVEEAAYGINTSSEAEDGADEGWR